MNSLTTLGGMIGRGGKNTNTISYINSISKNITIDFSGSDYYDLSYSPYAVTASGLNPNNENTTFALLKYNDENLKIADFHETGSFTLHIKHAARYSLQPVFNFRYPNVVTLTQTTPLSLTAKFLSSLNPGTVIPYTITGCTTSDLNIASLNGSFTSSYNTITYTLSSGINNTITFNVSGGFSTSIFLQPANFVYTVTVSGGVYWLSKNGGAAEEQPFILFTQGTYLFDQSHPSNAGNTLVFGQTLDSTPYYTHNVVTNGTAGSPNAYTLIDLSGQTLPSPALKYFSQQTAGMGHSYIIYFQDLIGTSGTPFTLSNVSASLAYPKTVEFQISFIDNPSGDVPQHWLSMVSNDPTYLGAAFDVRDTQLTRNIMLNVNATTEYRSDSAYAMESIDNSKTFDFMPVYGRNKWNHIAICALSNTSTPTLFINGKILHGRTTTYPIPWGLGFPISNLSFPGAKHGICNLQYRNIRISNTIRYTGAYTVPTTFPSDSNTVFSMDLSGNTICNSKTNSITLANFNLGSSF
jgi:hypothetical protein